MLSVNPLLGPAEIVNIMKTTSIDLLSPGVDLETGYGRLNAFNAVLKVKNFCLDDLIIGDLHFFNDFTLRALNTITTGQNVRILSNISGTIIAGEKIVFNAGFEMHPNSELMARTDNVICSVAMRSIVEKQLITTPDDEIQDCELIKFFPNPYADRVKILIPETISDVPFILYDINGNRVFESADITKSNSMLQFEGEVFNPGLYMYEYYINGRKKTGKLIRR